MTLEALDLQFPMVRKDELVQFDMELYEGEEWDSEYPIPGTHDVIVDGPVESLHFPRFHPSHVGMDLVNDLV